MFSHKAVRGVLVWLVAGACWASLSASADAQTDLWSQIQPGGGAQFYLAQQPGGAPAAPAPAPEPAYPPAPSYDQLASAAPFTRLASVPNMFGDFFAPGMKIHQSYDSMYDPSLFDSESSPYPVANLPLGGAVRRIKIAENNKALPMDRVYFMYNRFENALEASTMDQWGHVRSDPVDRYTFGAEKTFCGGWNSIEIRMPFVDRYGYEATDMGIIGGPVGNLGVSLKQMIYASRCMALALGLGIETPTGSNVRGLLGPTPYTLHNDALHLSPWVGMLMLPCDRVFFEMFLQWDVATNSNRLTVDGTQVGKLDDQNLMYVDLLLGYWLYQNAAARWINGIAPVIEFHYTTTLQDTDLVTVNGVDSLYYHFINPENRVDVANFNVGLHTQLGLTTVSVAGAFPLRGGSNKLFDAELQVYLNRNF